MLHIIASIALFATLVFFFIEIFLIQRAIRNPEAKRLKKQLEEITGEAPRRPSVTTIRLKQQRSDIPWLNRVLSSAWAPLIHWFDQILLQSNTQHPLGVFVLFSLLLGLSGFCIVFRLTRSYPLAFPAGGLASTLPFFYLSIKRMRRMRKFEQQLPDALDLIARALKAGQAFPGGLQMVAQEFDDPIGPEFEKTFVQINLGAGYQEALKSLTDRVDCPDLKFFAISVIIQRQTGGNLAEILENISRLIRERFKLRGHVRALAAEGKLSACVLIALPFLIFITLSCINPDYVNVLVTNDIGKMLIFGSLVMMMLGVFIMKKIATIKV
ncbi:MAG: type II secretion system F family protein [bacterium]